MRINGQRFKLAKVIFAVELDNGMIYSIAGLATAEIEHVEEYHHDFYPRDKLTRKLRNETIVSATFSSMYGTRIFRQNTSPTFDDIPDQPDESTPRSLSQVHELPSGS